MSVECRCNVDNDFECEHYFHIPGKMYMRNGDPGYPPEEGCKYDYDETECPYVVYNCDSCEVAVETFDIDDDFLGQLCEDCAKRENIPDEDAEYIARCPCCNGKTKLTINKLAYFDWKYNGKLIQDVFPKLTVDERELLQTGICNDCFPKEE